MIITRINRSLLAAIITLALGISACSNMIDDMGRKPALGSNAYLEDLQLSIAGLSPAFSSYIMNYALMASLVAQDVTLTPVAMDPDATITINGTTCTSGEASNPLTLDLGENDIQIVVRAPSGVEQTYTVELVRGMRQAYIKASNTDAQDAFGSPVAIYGDTLAVAARDEDSAATGINGDQGSNTALASGAVYIFVRSGNDWVQQAYIKASDTENNDEFGFSISLYQDTLAVGAFHKDDFTGAVYVFTRSGTTWTQQACLQASNSGINDNFGYNVSLFGDTLAVGAWGESSAATGINGSQSSNTASSSGAVYVFTRSGTTWSQQAYIKASNTGAGDAFGGWVSLYGDTLAVGAHGEDSAAMGINGSQSSNTATNSGAVYVFTRSGTTWSQQAYIKASNTGADDEFGFTLALYGDTLAVGAPYESSSATGINGNQSDNNTANSGAVYVFTRSGITWSQQAYIKASNTGADDFFSQWSVALYGDTLAVGAYYEDSMVTGINGDQSDDTAINSGAVYVYTRSSTVWSQSAYVKASNTGTNDYFGESISLYDGILAVGAFGESSAATGINGDQSDNTATNSGAVYVFYDLIDNLW